MNVQYYTDPAQFLADAGDFLNQHPTANTLQISLALALQQPDHPYKQPPLLAVMRDDRGVVLTCLMTPPHPLNLSLLRDHADADQTVAMLAHELHQHGWRPTMVNAAPDIAKAFAHAWTTLTGGHAQRKMQQRIYELETVISPQNVTGTMRQATERDIPLVQTWISAFAAEATDPISDDEALESAQRRITAGQVYVWQVNDQPVSMAAWSRPMPPRITISLVYTPPASRKRGYASAVVAHLSQHLLGNGYDYCMLFTDLANPTSNAIYQQIGYQPVSDVDLYELKSA